MINLITLFDLIYIAGFLDGDGAILAQFVTRPAPASGGGPIHQRWIDDYKWKYQIRLSIQFTQHTKRSIYLTKLKDIIGAGSVRHRTKGINLNGELPNDSSVLNGTSKVNGNEGVSDYVITASESVLALLKQLQPYLRIKQKQADLAITLLEQLPLAKNDKVKFIELVDIVDQIASLNDSKVSKRTLTGAVVKEVLKKH
jgi:hypothetical protein